MNGPDLDDQDPNWAGLPATSAEPHPNISASDHTIPPGPRCPLPVVRDDNEGHETVYRVEQCCEPLDVVTIGGGTIDGDGIGYMVGTWRVECHGGHRLLVTDMEDRECDPTPQLVAHALIMVGPSLSATLEATDPEPWQYAVVTRVPPDGDAGNLAIVPGLSLDEGEGRTKSVAEMGQQGLGLMLALRCSVFHLGEIMVMSGGREVAGLGRKPSKWDVDVQEVATMAEAVELARSVIDHG